MVFSKKNLNSKEPAKNQWPVLYQFFHENRWCFEAFETTSIDGSLILKYLKNWNQWFFKNSKTRLTLDSTTHNPYNTPHYTQYLHNVYCVLY